MVPHGAKSSHLKNFPWAIFDQKPKPAPGQPGTLREQLEKAGALRRRKPRKRYFCPTWTVSRGGPL